MSLADVEALRAAFLAETGWKPRAVRRGGRWTTQWLRRAVSGAGTPLLPDAVKTQLARLFADVDEALAPYKATFPAGEVVLHFTHPGMAAQHAERLRTSREPRTGASASTRIRTTSACPSSCGSDSPAAGRS